MAVFLAVSLVTKLAKVTGLGILVRSMISREKTSIQGRTQQRLLLWWVLVDVCNCDLR